jgi:hypothetical protein
MGRKLPVVDGCFRPKADVVNRDKLPFGERRLHLWRSKLFYPNAAANASGVGLSSH